MIGWVYGISFSGLRYTSTVMDCGVMMLVLAFRGVSRMFLNLRSTMMVDMVESVASGHV